MANDDNKYGVLINSNIKLNRQYFREMVKLLGIKVLYRAPKPDKHYTTYAEIDSNYERPIMVGCVFHDHPTQQTLKKLGWMSELDDSASLIEVDYDLPGLQQGALFIVPSGLDNGKARLFRVTKLTNSMVYPTSITCQIVPEYEDTLDNSIYDTSYSDFNVVPEEHEKHNYAPLGYHEIKIKEEEDQWS